MIRASKVTVTDGGPPFYRSPLPFGKSGRLGLRTAASATDLLSSLAVAGGPGAALCSIRYVPRCTPQPVPWVPSESQPVGDSFAWPPAF